MKKLFLLLIIVFISCNSEQPTQFSTDAYKEMLIGLDDSKITLREVLYNYKGKKIFIDVWASWCKDCIVGVPKVKELQKEYALDVDLFEYGENEKNAILKPWLDDMNQFINNHYIKMIADNTRVNKTEKEYHFITAILINVSDVFLPLDSNGLTSR